MKKNTPVSALLSTNCTIIEASADIAIVRDVFNFFPNQFLPVVEGIRLVGVIFRADFFRDFLCACDEPLCAADLVSKEVATLFPHNTVVEAMDVFDACAYDVLPVVDADGDLAGILIQEEVEEFLNAPSKPSVLSVLRGVLTLHF